MSEKLLKYIFDTQDADLFLSEDRDLKARAVRCSIIPCLLELANSAIAEVEELYAVEPLATATVAYSPYRIESRGSGFKYDCKSALAGLTPIRRKGAYLLLGKDRTIFPLNLRFLLDEKGLRVAFHVDCRNESCRTRLFEFFQKYEREIMAMMLSVRGGAYVFGQKRTLWHMFPCRICEQVFKTSDHCAIYLLSHQFQYPIDERAACAAKHYFTQIYPIFHAACLLAIGRDGVFNMEKSMMTALAYSRKWLEQNMASASQGKDENVRLTLDEDAVNEIADKRIHVMPGKRWQVFERDQWRCVSCGKSADDGAILEIDHILPRSKGGSDDIANLQTLCRECNIGKSNKNQTDLRNRKLTHAR